MKICNFLSKLAPGIQVNPVLDQNFHAGLTFCKYLDDLFFCESSFHGSCPFRFGILSRTSNLERTIFWGSGQTYQSVIQKLRIIDVRFRPVLEKTLDFFRNSFFQLQIVNSGD